MVTVKPITEEVDASVKELLLAYRCGQISRDEAFDEIVRLIHPPIATVLRYVYGVKIAQDQDDLFQEVMLRFVRSERTYNLEQPILPWLYQIARNVKLDAIGRSRKYRDETEESMTWRIELRSQDHFTEVQARNDRVIALEKALDALPETDREIIWLKYYAGCTDQQMANHLKVRLSTVKFYLYRAKKKLCDLMHGKNPPDAPPPVSGSGEASISEGRGKTFGTFFIDIGTTCVRVTESVIAPILIKGVMTMNCTDEDLHKLFRTLRASEKAVSVERTEKAVSAFRSVLKDADSHEEVHTASAAVGSSGTKRTVKITSLFFIIGTIFITAARLMRAKAVYAAAPAMIGAMVGLLITPAPFVLQNSSPRVQPLAGAMHNDVSAPPSNVAVDKTDFSDATYSTAPGTEGAQRAQLMLSFVPQPFPTASNYSPKAVAADFEGNLYVSDSANNRISTRNFGTHSTDVVDVAITSGTSQFVTTVAGDGSSGFSIDSAGNLYVADFKSNRVVRISSDGNTTVVAGNGLAGYDGDGGPATDAQLNTPTGVAVDHSGNVYITDTSNDRIRKVSNGIITTFAGNGSAGFAGDSSSITSAQQLIRPSSIAVDDVGNLYVADNNNRRIQKISTNGIITTVAGNDNAGDDSPISAQLNATSLAVDAVGTLYVYDNEASQILKISADGIVTTVASSNAERVGSASGAREPESVALCMLNAPTSWAGIRETEIIDFSLLNVPVSARLNAPNFAMKYDLAGNFLSEPSIANIARNTTEWHYDGGHTPAGQVRVFYSTTPSRTSSRPDNWAFVPMDAKPSTSGVINSASYDGGSIAPGEIVTVYGAGLGPSMTVSVQPDSRGYVAGTLAGTQVLFDGIPAPILYTTANQVSAVVPYAVSGNTFTQMQVAYRGQFSTAITVPVDAAASNPLMAVSSGSSSGIIVNEDGTTNSVTTPAVSGSTVFIYATGEGQSISGRNVSIAIDGHNAQVLYSGNMHGSEAEVFRVKLPQSAAPGSAIPVTIDVGGSSKQMLLVLK